MIKVAVIGSRDGGYLIEQINEKARNIYEVVALGDNNDSLWGKPIENLRVCSVDEIIKQYLNGCIERIIVAVRKGYSRFQIIRQLKEKGIKRIRCIKPGPLTYRRPIVFEKGSQLYSRQWMDLDKTDKPIIHHLEINIADGCNLNCKGCLHFSSLFNKNEFPDEEELLISIQKVASKCEIFQFRVLGGEPLLYPGLEAFLVKLRTVLPYTDLAVISNGILIPKMPESLFEVMKENDIGFNLTLYPPTLKMKESIYKTLDSAGVAYGSHEARTDRFERFLMREPSAIDTKPYEVCVPRGILVIRGKCIYRCPVEAYINRYYKAFKIERTSPEGIDVNNDNHNWSELIDDLYTKPHELCAFCSSKSEYYEWSNGNSRMEDWLIANEE